MLRLNTKTEKRNHRHRRIRSRVRGGGERLRLAVFRSNKHVLAQLINDELGQTLAAASDRETKKLKREEAVAKLSSKVADAYLVGQLLATKAIGLHIKKVVFDRGGYLYAGRVKALAEGARAGGLDF